MNDFFKCIVFLFSVHGVALGYESHTFPVEIRFYENLTEIPANQYLGYSAFGGYAIPTKNGCIVYSPKITSWEEHSKLELLGHEMLHCILGPHK